MSRDVWTAVDTYLEGLFIPADTALERVLQSSSNAGLPPIQVSPVQGQFLMLLGQICGAKHILEIGTLGGYSTLWLAKGLAGDGDLITLESEPRHAEVAGKNIEAAGLGDRVEIRVGLALDTLPRIAKEIPYRFDLIFIDADKANISEYFDWALRLSQRGSVIIVDNVIRDGRVLDAASDDPNVQGVRRFNERLKSEKRVITTTLQTVGSKGYDGFAMAVVGAD